jgi:hypothetical protein
MGSSSCSVPPPIPISVYLIRVIFSITCEENKLVNIEQVNYLIFWFVTANIFYSVGKLFGKITGVKTFHHFGFMVGLFVLVIEIGLAHGFNTFIFI